MISPRQLSTPPPEESTETLIKYTKKARHGHGKDVTDAHNVRQVAGCLAIDPVTNRCILISSSKNPEAWVIPKGGWEIDETQEEAALRETWEEAGLKGRIIRKLGVFVERANKRIKAHHWIFEMEIYEIVKKFPERKKRDRRWFTYDEAMLATQNNPYIQEAIRVSILSPAHQPKKPLSLTAEEEESDSSLPSTPTTATTTTTQDTTAATTTTNEKSNDAFQTLQELMENTSISP
ncbi:NUDIX hydrolase domain-like protein [Thamnidium elegans]|uniref:Nudix hydrolase domain-containing protein n=1 Tax=Thamnidium elegans TaxID=101142 RepID=A0A8H7SHS7_9FUNG|nr:hypothetical protein INT48_004821 [Thamnidium elegans]KAI8069013.1 NUDIX hydrolase domain-like protein [Thamnidium elegans]